MIEHVSIPEERIKILRKDEKWRDKLKKFVDVDVKIIDEEIVLEHEDPLILMRVKEVMKAFGRGFDFDISLDLLDEGQFLEVLNVGDFAGKSRERKLTLKGRVIGREGKSKEIIEKYAGVKVAIYGKTISIIGRWENVKVAARAIQMLLCGSKHTTVYRFLKIQKMI